jgi:hypothetical protein
MASEPTSEDSYISRLAESLDGAKAIATFSCGGKITLKLRAPNETVSAGTPEAPILFYEDKNGDCRKVVFPASAGEMEKLTSVCDPASFGVGTQTVMDLDYRSAWKLDNTKFASSFNHDEIMEIVQKMLFALDGDSFFIASEMYKLNVARSLFAS